MAHELTHARRHDVLYKWFAAGVTSLHWFNPLMILVRREINRACELSCDEAVIRGLDEDGRRHYGQTLLDLAASPTSRSGQLTITLSDEKTQLKERLVSIVNYHKKGAAAIIMTLLLVLVMAGCALVNGAELSRPQTNEPPQAPVSKASRTQAGGAAQSAGTEDSPAPDDPAGTPATAPEEVQAGDKSNGPRMDITVSDGRRLTFVMRDVQGTDHWPQTYRELQILDGDNIIQTITQDDVSLDEGYLFDGFLANFSHPQIQDVNFDGAEDFGLICGPTYNGPLCWFVWEQEDGQFHFAFFSSLELEVDQDKHQLVDVWKDGGLGWDYYIYEYNDQKERIQVDYYYKSTSR